MRAAVKIAEKLGNTELFSMRNKPEEVPAADYDVIGFIYPVYHWTLPEPVVQFVKALEVNTKAYIFAVAMPSFVLGFACERLEELLNKKNASLSYATKVNSVANYVIVYPPMPSPSLVVPKTEKKLEMIGEEIRERKTRKIPHAGWFVKKRYEKVMPQYKELQKYADSKFTISEDCIACGLCSKVCPCQNIVMKHQHPTFQSHCSQCMACVCYCPKRAIGFKIEEEDLKQIQNRRVPVIKIMGLPKNRKRYHNPYISAADLSKDRISVGFENSEY